MRSSIPWPNITTATLIALSISKFAHAERDVPTGWAVANTNAQCDKPVRITDPNIDRPLGWFATDRGYPVCRVYSSKDGLPGAESKSGTGCKSTPFTYRTMENALTTLRRCVLGHWPTRRWL